MVSTARTWLWSQPFSRAAHYPEWSLTTTLKTPGAYCRKHFVAESGPAIIALELNQNQQIAASDTNRLSERELEVLRLAANGMSNKEVGAKLFIAPTTARDHMQSVMRKLNVRSRTAAAVAVLKLGLLDA